MFNTLHVMFETQYTELALAVDLIAERIRALGYPAPGSYAQYAKLSVIKESEAVPAAEDQISQTSSRARKRSSVLRARFFRRRRMRPTNRPRIF